MHQQTAMGILRGGSRSSKLRIFSSNKTASGRSKTWETLNAKRTSEVTAERNAKIQRKQGEFPPCAEFVKSFAD